MSEIKWLPSYARPGEQVVFDKATLRTGRLQEEATRFFLWVARQVEPEDLKAKFRSLIEEYPGAKEAQGQFALQDNLLVMTVALALLKDIGPLAPYIINDNVPLGSVSSLIKDLSAGLELDIVDQLTRKGDLSLQMFCMTYSVKAENLAIKLVLDDNPQAYEVFKLENPQACYKAMARVPYNPLSAIRGHIGLPVGEMAFDEMETRIRMQFTAFYQHQPMINPNKPSVLQPIDNFEYETIDTLDHQLRPLPGYLRTLGTYQDELLLRFGGHTRQVMSIDGNQLKLLANLLEDMERAGISRIDILMKGVINFEPVMEGLHWKRPAAELKAQYQAMTPEEKQAMYLPMLLEGAAHYGDNQDEWNASPKLLQINHFIRKEPIDALEALCTTPSHWHALYRATGDRKYVPKLAERAEKMLSEDLGL
ncbi:hypothetical protein [Pseudomonas amygdali]|uniref:Uncharacterized protein n=2 Tax=Pseudomonas amygdali pv. lachrymans TaxID=53707 RepID=A0ABR5KQB1_PSEAV|nr:hypothetical protein [Pseudomonas amygdali]AXH59556.1 hypothetical protein PLA107_030485 [Pseudomonas amygdali pv. lachrymans str. M301315]KPC16983.1 Uncharacterized protein AC499_0185 [Pseudomonas amygdali pv. lachrymans]KPC17942.1 Uncharacterized protein AC499_1144 [Pseudomonas amygdali pv. lachrymans]